MTFWYYIWYYVMTLCFFSFAVALPAASMRLEDQGYPVAAVAAIFFGALCIFAGVYFFWEMKEKLKELGG